MKNKKIVILKSALFFLILIFSWYCIENILKKPNDEKWDASGLNYVYDNPENYDVFFAGTSVSIMNISCEELYLDYGIKSVTLGEPMQPMFLTYYTIKEALKNQNPKAIVLDTQALFYSDELIAERFDKEEQESIHYSLDNMKNNENKMEALKQVKQYKENIDYWDYYSKMYYGHSNWEALDKKYFIRDSLTNIINGNLMMIGTKETGGRNYPISSVTNIGEKETLIESNLVYLKKIIDLCKEREISLILFRGVPQLEWSWTRYNTINAVAQENNIDFIDINTIEDEIGIDWRTDTTDGLHANISGAKKFSNYIGKFLIEKNIIEKGGQDNSYFEANSKTYYMYLKTMEDKISLLNAIEVDDYIPQLDKIWNDKYAIITMKKEAGQEERIRRLINNADKENIDSTSDLFAIIENGNIVNMFNNLEDLNFEMKVLGMNLQIQDIDCCDSGLNIWVYDKNVNEVISNVFFYDEDSQIYRVDNEKEYYESDVNNWVERQGN